MFGSRVGFSGSADRIAVFQVKSKSWKILNGRVFRTPILYNTHRVVIGTAFLLLLLLLLSLLQAERLMCIHVTTSDRQFHQQQVDVAWKMISTDAHSVRQVLRHTVTRGHTVTSIETLRHTVTHGHMWDRHWDTVARGHTVCETGIETHSRTWTHSVWHRYWDTQSHVDTQFVRQALRHTVTSGHTVCETGIETHSRTWTHSLWDRYWDTQSHVDTQSVRQALIHTVAHGH